MIRIRFLVSLLLIHPCAFAAGSLVLDCANEAVLSMVDAQGSDLKRVTNPNGPAIQVSTGTGHKWPGLSMTFTNGLDASSYQTITVTIRNPGQEPLSLKWRMDSLPVGTAKVSDDIATRIVGISLDPGESQSLRIRLFQRQEIPGISPGDFFGMRGKPFFNPRTLYLENLTRMVFFSMQGAEPRTFEIGSIQLEGDVEVEARTNAPTITADEVFPLIDEFGQFKHADWPGKLSSLEDLVTRRDEEAKWLESRSRPASWNQYGGWKDGPRLEATGWFRTAKHKGKWHLVDPEGHLFFSVGINGVKFPPGTIVNEREHWFESMLDDTPANRDFWFGFRPSLERSHWTGRRVRAFRFHKHNVMRKYGADYVNQFAETSLKRLPAWGINTLGNWSDPEVYLRGKVPYVAFLRPGSKGVEGSSGHWGKFCDVFDDDFVNRLRRQTRRKDIARTVNDPMCIGYFVDNELTFGDDTSLAVATLISPATQRAKQVFVEDLKAKYGEIAALNQVWKSTHASWEDLLNATEEPDLEAARGDLEVFYRKFVRKYFKTIHDELRAFAPNHLYLGCRFGSSFPVNDVVMDANVEFVDVISLNLYARHLKEKIYRMDKAGDKPLIIGEFHFGALDRGMFDTGLVSVEDQEERAQAFSEFVLDCVKHPNIVGCHWFQYVDSPNTGRPWDNENYQIGFTDVCDSPYAELIEASRNVGEQLYPAE